jgi:hypothetical protein
MKRNTISVTLNAVILVVAATFWATSAQVGGSYVVSTGFGTVIYTPNMCWSVSPPEGLLCR